MLLLGSTGSIGTQTLEVIEHLNALHARGEWRERYEVVGLAAGRSAEKVCAQAKRFGVRDVAIASGPGNETAAIAGAAGIERGRLRVGGGSAEALVRELDCDVVLAAMVGVAGLPAAMAAVELGRDVALANKETLVAAGSLVTAACARTGARLLPVDSEHAGVWRALAGSRPKVAHDQAQGHVPGPQQTGEPGRCVERLAPPFMCASDVHRITLTASGGPFRTRTRDEVYHATPEEALKHPTWTMGPKVTIDSASLMNKALELIEAHWLFGVGVDRLGAIVHPQSAVHAIVEYADGNTVAQMAPSTMLVPILQALTWDATHTWGGAACGDAWPRLDLAKLGALEFFEPDLERFPALGLGFEVIRRGGVSGAVMNAANEVAVDAFLNGRIPFGRIPEVVESAMNAVGDGRVSCPDDVLAADAEGRRAVEARIAR